MRLQLEVRFPPVMVAWRDLRSLGSAVSHHSSQSLEFKDTYKIRSGIEVTNSELNKPGLAYDGQLYVESVKVERLLACLAPGVT